MLIMNVYWKVEFLWDENRAGEHGMLMEILLYVGVFYEVRCWRTRGLEKKKNINAISMGKKVMFLFYNFVEHYLC